MTQVLAISWSNFWLSEHTTLVIDRGCNHSDPQSLRTLSDESECERFHCSRGGAVFPFLVVPLNALYMLQVYFKLGDVLTAGCKMAINSNAACHLLRWNAPQGIFEWWWSIDLILCVLPFFLSVFLLTYARESSKWEKKNCFGLHSLSTFHFGFTPNSRYMAL